MVILFYVDPGRPELCRPWKCWSAGTTSWQWAWRVAGWCGVQRTVHGVPPIGGAYTGRRLSVYRMVGSAAKFSNLGGSVSFFLHPFAVFFLPDLFGCWPLPGFLDCEEFRGHWKVVEISESAKYKTATTNAGR